MEEKEARKIVKRLIRAAFDAGLNSRNPTSLIYRYEAKKALEIGEDVIRHIIAHAADREKVGG